MLFHRKTGHLAGLSMADSSPTAPGAPVPPPFPDDAAGPVLVRACARMWRRDTGLADSQVAARLDALAAWLDAAGPWRRAQLTPQQLRGTSTSRAEPERAGLTGTSAGAISLPGTGGQAQQSGPHTHFSPSGDFSAPASRQPGEQSVENPGEIPAQADSQAPLGPGWSLKLAVDLEKLRLPARLKGNLTWDCGHE